MPGIGEVTRHCPSDDGCIALGYQHAGQPIGAEDGDDPPKRSSRIVHDFQDAMTEHHVGGFGPEQVVQVGRVALDGFDPAFEASLGRPSLERRQCVGTGIHDGDPMPLTRKRDRKTTRPSARVDDIEAVVAGLRHPFGQCAGQHIPYDSGPHMPPEPVSHATRSRTAA